MQIYLCVLCTCKSVCLCVNFYAHADVCMEECMYVCICVSVSLCAFIYVHGVACLNAGVFIYVHDGNVCMGVCVCVCVGLHIMGWSIGADARVEV